MNRDRLNLIVKKDVIPHLEKRIKTRGYMYLYSIIIGTALLCFQTYMIVSHLLTDDYVAAALLFVCGIPAVCCISTSIGDLQKILRVLIVLEAASINITITYEGEDHITTLKSFLE